MRSGWKANGERRFYFTYIMSNKSMTLYTGVTNDVARRAIEHKSGEDSGFTSRYHFDRLVWYEYSTDVVAAIAREKQVKGMSREKKIEMIKRMNPAWIDLSADWNRYLSS